MRVRAVLRVDPWRGPLLLLGIAGYLVLTYVLANDTLYVQGLVLVAAVFGILAVSLDLVAGVAGLYSLGHAGLFAIGAYGTTILHNDHGWNLFLLLPASMFFAAVALTAFAALLAGTAQARIPEGNGTQPPSGKVVDENALASMLASSAQASRPEGNGTQPPPGAVVREQKLSQQKSVVEKLGEIGAWAVPSTSQHKPHLLRHTNKLGEIGAWATLPATKSAIIARG